MGTLKTEGFAKLVEMVAQEAAAERLVRDAAMHAATLGERLAVEVALGALSRHEAFVLHAAEKAGAQMGPVGPGESLALTSTGRLRILRAGEPEEEGVLTIGRIEWGAARPASLDQECDEALRRDADEIGAVADWLRSRPAGEAQRMVAGLQTLLSHVGPMRVYIGPHCYTNLGRASNLVGKSLAVGSDRCRLSRLADVPVAQWPPEDACFVVLMTALIGSGTPSRTEEMSGTQLMPGRLEAFIRDRIAAYDGSVPRETDELALVDRLFALSAQARELRPGKLRGWPPFYRTVQSMTIHKQEHLFTVPVTAVDLPGAFVEKLMWLLPGTDVAGTSDWESAWTAHAVRAHENARDAAFTTHFEQVVHDLVEAGTEATVSHVGMSRGPRDMAELSRQIAAGSTVPGHWKTSDYYCCVVPSRDFGRRFADNGVPEELTQVVRAIAARMRWNGWHFMPHASGVGDDPSFADRDWFYAPTMPDVTEWTSHHHQGHVANGVRHAIRVPFPLTLAGASRPGIHDFRLMRTDGDPYTLQDFRAAVAIGQVLRGLYQSYASQVDAGGRALVISDFDNRWYQRRFTAAALV
ncbi:hypothetical protein Ssi03_13870 [Sphaerisporangium siamense]|uniref:Uncharacterized protein n=1 Tax=Sphaerisporangium siamense TaxID=795645 RepID=A0A7W7DBY6_9ACTN|nr:hypothetical protein [Sphaerisporangium siamense]MBB4702846.1 hypothetical protein [Sphaerisporangium siamense]GII83397.1 hypothetical protein Ssi03_13870 [Sphaerisporangium siamense]